MSNAFSGETQAHRPLHAKRRLLWLAAGVACYLLSLLLARFQGFTEMIYGTGIGPRIAQALSLLTSVIPLSLAELLVFAFLARYVTVAFRAFRRIRSGAHPIRHGLQRLGLTVAQDVGILMVFFYLLWGFNYARAPLPERLAWPATTGVTVDELAQLAAQLVDGANEAYLALHGTSDAGTPTVLGHDTRTVERALDTGWREARASLHLPSLAGPYGRTKFPLFTKLYEWFGVSGFYFPFTGEANVRRGIPAVQRAKSMAHEKAHQRGVAREAEANFWGYLAAAHSDLPIARYSAYVFAQRQLLSALYRADPARASALVAARLPGVQRDITDLRNYWRNLQSGGSAVGTAVNDAYLKTNRVTGGVRNYSYSVQLIIAYARSGGQVVTSRETE